jgi:hypothetical protein
MPWKKSTDQNIGEEFGVKNNSKLFPYLALYNNWISYIICLQVSVNIYIDDNSQQCDARFWFITKALAFDWFDIFQQTGFYSRGISNLAMSPEITNQAAEPTHVQPNPSKMPSK